MTGYYVTENKTLTFVDSRFKFRPKTPNGGFASLHGSWRYILGGQTASDAVTASGWDALYDEWDGRNAFWTDANVSKWWDASKDTSHDDNHANDAVFSLGDFDPYITGSYSSTDTPANNEARAPYKLYRDETIWCKMNEIYKPIVDDIDNHYNNSREEGGLEFYENGVYQSPMAVFRLTTVKGYPCDWYCFAVRDESYVRMIGMDFSQYYGLNDPIGSGIKQFNSTRNAWISSNDEYLGTSTFGNTLMQQNANTGYRNRYDLRYLSQTLFGLNITNGNGDQNTNYKSPAWLHNYWDYSDSGWIKVGIHSYINQGHLILKILNINYYILMQLNNTIYQLK